MRAETRPLEVLDDFPDPVVVVDRGGAIVYATAAAATALGRVRESLVGQELAPLFEPEGRLELRRTLARLLEAEGTARLEVTQATAAETPSPGRGTRWELSLRRFEALGRTLFFVSGAALDARCAEPAHRRAA